MALNATTLDTLRASTQEKARLLLRGHASSEIPLGTVCFPFRPNPSATPSLHQTLRTLTALNYDPLQIYLITKCTPSYALRILSPHTHPLGKPPYRKDLAQLNRGIHPPESP